MCLASFNRDEAGASATEYLIGFVILGSVFFALIQIYNQGTSERVEGAGSKISKLNDDVAGEPVEKQTKEDGEDKTGGLFSWVTPKASVIVFCLICIGLLVYVMMANKE